MVARQVKLTKATGKSTRGRKSHCSNSGSLGRSCSQSQRKCPKLGHFPTSPPGSRSSGSRSFGRSTGKCTSGREREQKTSRRLSACLRQLLGIDRPRNRSRIRSSIRDAVAAKSVRCQQLPRLNARAGRNGRIQRLSCLRPDQIKSSPAVRPVERLESLGGNATTPCKSCEPPYVADGGQGQICAMNSGVGSVRFSHHDCGALSTAEP